MDLSECLIDNCNSQDIGHSCRVHIWSYKVDINLVIEHRSTKGESEKLVRLENGASDPYAFRSVRWVLGEDGLIVSNAIVLCIQAVSLFFFFVSFVVLFFFVSWLVWCWSVYLSFQPSTIITNYSFRATRLTL